MPPQALLRSEVWSLALIFVLALALTRYIFKNITTVKKNEPPGHFEITPKIPHLLYKTASACVIHAFILTHWDLFDKENPGTVDAIYPVGP
jgi:hypothetical protein